jgi:glycosyltransferase involved in cell wall biosynthesis
VDKSCQFYIVVAVLNGQNYLERCLNSVLEQQYSNRKLIVIDGGSTDGTVEIIKKYQADLVWWVSEPDQGIYDAWNKALPHIENGWVLFLGADDILYSSDVLTLAADLLQFADPAIRVAYGRVSVVDEQDKPLAMKGVSWKVAGKSFTSIMTLPHQGVFHHSSLFQKVGNFNSELKIAGDYDLLLRVLPEQPPLFLENLIVASWRIGGTSYDVDTSLLVAREFSLVRRLNGFNSFSVPLTIFYLKAYVLRGLYLLFGYRFTRWIVGSYRRLMGEWS